MAEFQVRPVELIGKRTKLVPLNESHIPALCEAGSDPAIWRFMPAKIEAPDDIANHLRRLISEIPKGGELPFTVIDQETGRPVGCTCFLDITPAHKALEIGWTWLSPSVWRTRINTECKYLLLRHCFEELGAIRVFFKTDARNERSQKALERIGAVKEGVLRQHRIMPDGYLRDSVYYSILDKEWPAVKKLLEGYLRSE
jgi:RimJ/RimL family protein N-acetyltransferase